MREARHLRWRSRSVLASIGLMWIPAGITMAVPALVVIARPGEMELLPWFVGPGVVLAVAGGLGWRLLGPREGLTLSLGEGAVVVAVAWTSACFVGALPLVTGAGLDLAQAVFESTSGWTTTGLSVVDVESAPWMVLLYRSTLQFSGGAGFVIVALAALVGPVGTGLPTAEGRQDQLVPNVRRSAGLVARIYVAYAAAGFVLFWLAGMGWFDALNHSFAAVSTGGFSTRAASIGAWDSPWVELVCIVLMILGNVNFATAYAAFTGHLRSALRNPEVRVMAAVLPVAAVVLLLSTTLAARPDTGHAVRTAVFEAVSGLTTTGFSTTAYSGWRATGVFVLILLMVIGGGAGSTAGGLKQQRVAVLAGAVLEELRRRFRPASAVTSVRLWRGGRRLAVTADEVVAAGTYTALYLGTLAVGTIILCWHDLRLDSAMFEFASALGTVGLSVGVTTPATPPGMLWPMTAAMLLGRLEFFVLIVGFARLGRAVVRMAEPSTT